MSGDKKDIASGIEYIPIDKNHISSMDYSNFKKLFRLVKFSFLVFGIVTIFVIFFCGHGYIGKGSNEQNPILVFMFGLPSEVKNPEDAPPEASSPQSKHGKVVQVNKEDDSNMEEQLTCVKGQVKQKPCQFCICVDGKWACTRTACVQLKEKHH